MNYWRIYASFHSTHRSLIVPTSSPSHWHWIYGLLFKLIGRNINYLWAFFLVSCRQEISLIAFFFQPVFGLSEEIVGLNFFLFYWCIKLQLPPSSSCISQFRLKFIDDAFMFLL